MRSARAAQLRLVRVGNAAISLTWAIMTSDDRRSCLFAWSNGSLFRCCPGLPCSPGRRRRRTRKCPHCGTRPLCCDGTSRHLACPGRTARPWPRLPRCTRRRYAPTGLSRWERCCPAPRARRLHRPSQRRAQPPRGRNAPMRSRRRTGHGPIPSADRHDPNADRVWADCPASTGPPRESPARTGNRVSTSTGIRATTRDRVSCRP